MNTLKLRLLHVSKKYVNTADLLSHKLLCMQYEPAEEDIFLTIFNDLCPFKYTGKLYITVFMLIEVKRLQSEC